MDDLIYKKTMHKFRLPQDIDLPIDKYFRKKEECQLLSQDSDGPISDKGMVLPLTTHMGEMGLINKSVIIFKNNPLPPKRRLRRARSRCAHR